MDTPKVIVEDVPQSLKPKSEWSKDEDEEAHGNSRALNDIYMELKKYIFKLINTCSNAKEAWNTLQIAHEDTFKVHM